MRKGASLYSKSPAQVVLVVKKLACQCRRNKTWFQSLGQEDPLEEALASHSSILQGFPGGSVGNESVCNAGDVDSIPRSGRSPGGGHGNPLQYSCLENPMDRGAWRVTVLGLQRVGHDRSKWAGTLHKNEFRSKSTFLSPAKSAWYQANTISYIVLYRNRFIILFIQIIYF